MKSVPFRNRKNMISLQQNALFILLMFLGLQPVQASFA